MFTHQKLIIQLNPPNVIRDKSCTKVYIVTFNQLPNALIRYEKQTAGKFTRARALSKKLATHN